MNLYIGLCIAFLTIFSTYVMEAASENETPAVSRAAPESVTPTVSRAAPESVTPAVSRAAPETETPAVSRAAPETETPAVSRAAPETETPAVSRALSESAIPAVSRAPPEAKRSLAPAGEPRIEYGTPAGYAPTPGDPITIKKVITPVEVKKGVGNLLRVEVEVAYPTYGQISNISIYELVDDDLRIIPPPEGSLNNSHLINFKKLKSPQEIGELKLALLRGGSLISTKADLGDDVAGVSYLAPMIINYPLFNWDGISGVQRDERQNLSRCLRGYFDMEWADPDSLNISGPVINGQDKEVINITHKHNKYEWVKLEIDDGKLIMNTSDQRTYDLAVDSTEKGQRWIEDWNGILCLHVESLSGRERLFYWYYVRPKKSGIFTTESLARIGDPSYAGWPDIIYPIEITVYESDLRFEVTPILETHRVYANKSWLSGLFNEKLNIKYLITYTGDASRSYTNKIILKLDGPTSDCHYLNDKGEPADDAIEILNFSKENTTIPLKRSIVYPKPDSYQIPGLWIEDKLYPFEDTITVDTPIERNTDTIGFYINVIGFLLLIAFHRELKDALTSIFRSLREEGEAKEEK